MMISYSFLAIFIFAVSGKGQFVNDQNQYMLCRPINDKELPVPPKNVHPFVEKLTKSARMLDDQPSTSTETQSKIQELESRIAELEDINIAIVKCMVTPYYYISSPTRLGWHDAKVYCENRNAHLACDGIKNLVNRRKIADKFLPEHTSFWIGASDITLEGQWAWIDGNPVFNHEIHWESGVETNTPWQDCAMIYSQSAWRAIDNSCDHKMYALCEISNCL